MKTKNCEKFWCFKVAGPSCNLCIYHEIKQEKQNIQNIEALTQATLRHAEKKECLAQQKAELGNKLEIAQKRLAVAAQQEYNEDRRLATLRKLITSYIIDNSR
jgi:hypothetical protein